MNKHRLVVSAENNAYMAWQCKLFYYSCVTRLKHQPIVIVHETERDWHPDFYELAKVGCVVHTAPNYRTYGGVDQLPGRNHAGSLIKAAEICEAGVEFIAICDPDMIFLRSIELLDCLSGEFSSFMNYDQEYVEKARLTLGIEREQLDAKKHTLTVAVPYVVPTERAGEFGRQWLDAIEAFPPKEKLLSGAPEAARRQRRHIVMYGFGLTVVKLGLEMAVTRLIDHNYWPDAPSQAPVIHYAYGDERWTKRDYLTDKQIASVWSPNARAAEGTILNELLSQLREAGEFYRDPFPLMMSKG